MTDPNTPPVGPPSANQPAPPAGYGASTAPASAPAYQQQPNQQQPYGQQQPYQQQPYGQQYGQGAPEKYNVLSIISLVTGILGISLVAIITGHIGLGQIGRTQEKGRGFAIAGLILGYLGLLAGIAAVFFLIVFAAAYEQSAVTTG